MNDQLVVADCLRLTCRQAMIKGISQRTWQHVRKTGELPPNNQGRKEDVLLTSQILEMVKIKPHFSTDILAIAVGCSRSKVTAVFKAYHLSFLWQRLRYAGIELQELDPDLVKARSNQIHADGPGALVHIDAKRYGALKGGLLIIGMTVVDNFSGFAHLYLAPDGRKRGQTSVEALMEFASLFPAPIRRIYSDNGSEFVNSTVLGWAESLGISHKTTQPKHAWSNGKAERTQSMLKREVVIPALVDSRYNGQMFESIQQLQLDIDKRLEWYNHVRINGGRVNRGLPPYIVARECCGLNEEQRERVLEDLRAQQKQNNRSMWEGRYK